MQSELYKSANEKITPSDKWKAETLQKMKAAQSQNSHITSSKPPIKMHHSKMLLLSAAAIALVAVPILYFTNISSQSSNLLISSSPTAMAQQAMPEMASTQDEYSESAPENYAMQADDAGGNAQSSSETAVAPRGGFALNRVLEGKIILITSEELQIETANGEIETCVINASSQIDENANEIGAQVLVILATQNEENAPMIVDSIMLNP